MGLNRETLCQNRVSGVKGGETYVYANCPFGLSDKECGQDHVEECSRAMIARNSASEGLPVGKGRRIRKVS